MLSGFHHDSKEDLSQAGKELSLPVAIPALTFHPSLTKEVADVVSAEAIQLDFEDKLESFVVVISWTVVVNSALDLPVVLGVELVHGQVHLHELEADGVLAHVDRLQLHGEADLDPHVTLVLEQHALDVAEGLAQEFLGGFGQLVVEPGDVLLLEGKQHLVAELFELERQIDFLVSFHLEKLVKYLKLVCLLIII